MFRLPLPAVLLVALAATAQKPPKKRPITHADYEIWASATGVSLSPDGQFVAYTLNTPNADGAVVVKNVSTGGEYKVAVGSRGGTGGAGAGGGAGGNAESESAEDQFTPPAGGFGGGGGVAGSPTFTPDSKFLYFPLTPTKAETDKARAEQKPAPRAVLAVMDLKTGQVVKRLEKVRSFSIVGDGAGVLLTVMEPKPETTPAAPTPPKAEEKKDLTPQPPLHFGEGEQKADFPPLSTLERGLGGEVLATDQRGTRQPGGGGPGGTGFPPARPTFGNDLVVHTLADGKQATFADVQTYSVTKDVKSIVYTVNAKQTEKNGVYVAGLLAPESAAAIKTGVGRYYTLTWNTDQTKMAFYFDEKPTAPPAPPPVDPMNPQPAPLPDPDALARKPRVYVWERSAPTQVATATGTPPMAAALSPMSLVTTTSKVAGAVEVLGPATPGLKKGWQIVDRGGLTFTADGKKLVVSAAPEAVPATTPTAPAPAPATPGTPLPQGRGAQAQSFDMNLWHWKDEAIQPMQKVRAGVDRNKSYRCVYFLDSKEFRHLADEDRAVSVPAHGEWGVGSSDKKYRGQSWRSPNPSDYALVNVRTGDSKPLVSELGSAVFASPNNKAVAWFDGKDWFAAGVPDGKPVNLTAKLGVKFFDEEFDQPMTPRGYGQAGWSGDDKYLFVYDRFDIWRLAADGSGAKNVTETGRGLGVQLRLVRVEKADDKEEEATAEPTPGTPPGGPPGAGRGGAERTDRGLDATKPWLLRAENLTTRDTGFYRLQPSTKPQLLLMGARRYGVPTKAKKADTQILTVQTFKDYPDYYVSGSDFREVKRVTDINPRVKEFNWGAAELVSFKNTDGEPLQAVLIKPEDFDPTKKYPMMVYIYERLTQNLHGFVPPRAGTSVNPTYYASNGYLVLMPDITYTVGSPGQSALKCVLPAIQAVADKGFLNEQAVGIQGHSWGGYQIAYMVTQTNRFKAAEAGAPVSNMTSAYGGVRWESGMARQFQYEHTQSRIGATLWQAPMKYIENSPLFFADRVNTPLLMLHNDADGAVPWYQGIEYFLALRRLNKEVYLFNYNGQAHGLRNPAAMKDYTVRMQQFFDHHLKGKPMPEWMAKGVPYLEREKEKEQWKTLFEPEKK